VQRISPAKNIASPGYQRWLRHLNATGSDVYVSLNTLKEHARGRTKEDLKEVRHLYLDLDQDGARKLEAAFASRLSAGGVSDHFVTLMLRQGDAQVFKRYSQAKLNMMREALAQLDRRANEHKKTFGTLKPN